MILCYRLAVTIFLGELGKLSALIPRFCWLNIRLLKPLFVMITCFISGFLLFYFIIIIYSLLWTLTNKYYQYFRICYLLSICLYFDEYDILSHVYILIYLFLKWTVNVKDQESLNSVFAAKQFHVIKTPKIMVNRINKTNLPTK